MASKVLELPLQILNISGLDPTDETNFGKLKCIISLITCIITLITSILEICSSEWRIVTIVPIVETLMAAFETLIRWIVLVFYKNKICKLIEETKRFWKVDVEDSENKVGAATILAIILSGIKINSILTLSAGSLAIIAASVVTWGETLPFVSWFPKNLSYGYEIFYTIQLIYVYSTACLIIGTDGIFAAFCAHLISQFRLLNKKLENTAHIRNTNNFLKNLKICIRYHSRLIDFGNELGEIFVGLLFMQYTITVSATCAEFFMVSENFDDYFQIGRFITFVGTLMGEMAVYCFLAEIVMDESTNTATAVYFSDWYSRDIKKVGVHIQMIIQRASKPITFTGGGMFLIGRVLWLNVFKMSFSVYTLLTSLQ